MNAPQLRKRIDRLKVLADGLHKEADIARANQLPLARSEMHQYVSALLDAADRLYAARATLLMAMERPHTPEERR